MPDTINGIPTHVLVVHAVVVLVPLAAAMLVASAVWPQLRRKLGVLTPIVAFGAFVTVPIATNAGEWLRDHVADTPLIRAHTRIGDTLLPWALGIFVLSVAVWWVGRRYELEWKHEDGAAEALESETATDSGGGTALATRTATRTALPTWVTAAVAVVSIAVAGGGVYQLYRIGDSGAKAVWTNNFAPTSRVGSGG